MLNTVDSLTKSFVAPTEDELLIAYPNDVYLDCDKEADFGEYNDIILLSS